MAIENPTHPADVSKDDYKYFRFQVDRDSPNEALNGLLVVAALIATVTFQAIISPPSGFLSGDYDVADHMFLFGITLGCSSSMTLIEYLTAGLPYHRELRLSILSMMFAYGVAVGRLVSTGVINYIVLLICFLLPHAMRTVPRWLKRCC